MWNSRSKEKIDHIHHCLCSSQSSKKNKNQILHFGLTKGHGDYIIEHLNFTVEDTETQNYEVTFPWPPSLLVANLGLKPKSVDFYSRGFSIAASVKI